MKPWLYTILIIIFLLIFLVSGFFLLRYFVASRHQQSVFDELAHLVEEKPTSAAPSDPAETVAEADPYTMVTDPDTGAPVQVLTEYAQIYLRNNHTVGWLSIDGTKINYPVMQTPSQPDYYLTRDFNRQSSAHGCLYVQADCSVTAPSDNVIIYGHNMKDGSMFAALHDYKDENFFRSHPTITFDTLRQHQTYQILAVFYTTATEGEGFAYHEFTHAGNAEIFQQYVANCKALSIYETGVNATYGDKLITLSTCEYSQANGRLVVVAKLVKNP